MKSSHMNEVNGRDAPIHREMDEQEDGDNDRTLARVTEPVLAAFDVAISASRHNLESTEILRAAKRRFIETLPYVAEEVKQKRLCERANKSMDVAIGPEPVLSGILPYLTTGEMMNLAKADPRFGFRRLIPVLRVIQHMRIDTWNPILIFTENLKTLFITSRSISEIVRTAEHVYAHYTSMDVRVPMMSMPHPPSADVMLVEADRIGAGKVATVMINRMARLEAEQKGLSGQSAIDVRARHIFRFFESSRNPRSLVSLFKELHRVWRPRVLYEILVSETIAPYTKTTFLLDDYVRAALAECAEQLRPSVAGVLSRWINTPSGAHWPRAMVVLMYTDLRPPIGFISILIEGLLKKRDDRVVALVRLMPDIPHETLELAFAETFHQNADHLKTRDQCIPFCRDILAFRQDIDVSKIKEMINKDYPNAPGPARGSRVFLPNGELAANARRTQIWRDIAAMLDRRE